jgi:parvulin-like peptidyl-prolyl isomerase
MRQLLKRGGLHGPQGARARVLAGVAVAGIALLGAGAAWSQSIAKTVATVRLHEPQIISSPQFTAFASVVARLGGSDTVAPEDCRRVLDTLVDQYLAEQEAVERRLTLTEAEIDQQMVEQRRQIEQQLGLDRQLTDDQWRALIQRDTRLTLEEYRERFAAGLVTQRLVAQMRPDWLQEVPSPSEEDLKAFYNLNIQQFVQPDMVLVLHIFFETLGLDDAAVKQARERAEEALQELRDGASFDDLVVKYSDDPSSRYSGGELGNRYLRRDDAKVLETLGAAFLQTTFAVQAGEASQLVESQVGFHILKIDDRIAARLLTLDDPVTPRSPQTVRGQIAAFLAADRQGKAYQQAVQEVVTELREQSDIEIFENQLEAVCPAEPS